MSEQGGRRPVLLAITGVTATIILLFAYRKYSQASTAAATSLHRSNAIRRSRRRWRRGFAPRELERNPMESALQNLKRRIEERQPYGRYDNQLLFTIEQEHMEAGLFDLLPGNLSQIYLILSQSRDMTDIERDKLKFHINALFLQNFLQEEFPSGWIIGEDVEALVQELVTHGIDEDCIRMIARYFDHGKPLMPENWDIRDELNHRGSNTVVQTEDAVEHSVTQQAIEALAGPTQDDGSSDSSDDDESDPGGSQNMLDLLYHIASEQAKREGFIHRGIRCNNCGISPIQGVRYHCSNCVDFDLCEDCEAQQPHNRSHVFYKVRIPAPHRGQLKQKAPVWYPGQPNAFPSTMPRDLQRLLVADLGMDKTEMEASYEQFKCLAGEHIPIEDDPAHLGMAISRRNFDMYFTPTGTDRPPPPNLIYDRIFAFYDYHNDGIITLDEYITGICSLMDKSRGARLKRIFMGFDLDGDGFVDRKDFLRMLRAYYALNQETTREMFLFDDERDDDIRDVVQGSQPISAAFGGNRFAGHASRIGQDKEIDMHGDHIITEGPDGVLQPDFDMTGDRWRAIGNAAVQEGLKTSFEPPRTRPDSDDPLITPLRVNANHAGTSVPFVENIDGDNPFDSDPGLHIYAWPPQQAPETEDVINALGADVPMDDITDPVDRSRVIHMQLQRLEEESRGAAIRERWKRRQFYLDEEEGSGKPPGYTEPDSSDEEITNDEVQAAETQTLTISRRQSMRSRSSSKVRFDDSAIDTDHETRSNASSRSIPINERWGGFELSGPERDVGREIIYQAVQQGFNELMDPLFKRKEDEAMETFSTRAARMRWKKQIDDYEAALKKRAEAMQEAMRQADMLRTQALFSNGVDTAIEAMRSETLSHNSSSGTEHDQQARVEETIDSESESGVEVKEGSDSLNATQVQDPPTEPPADTNKVIDQTLPQNKPNDPSFVANTDTTDLASQPQTKPSNTGSITSAAAADPNIHPPEHELRIWLRHRKIDEEAVHRGGYARLSYREFCHIMIREATRDAMGGNGNGTANGKITGDEGHEYGRHLNIDPEEWSSTADLGHMSFVGAWIEMGQF